MARGASSKEIITKKILETFPGSFVDGREIRIPMTEAGGLLQVKCSLTAAKTNIENPAETTLTSSGDPMPADAMNMPEFPTDDEKARVEELLTELKINKAIR